MSQQPRKKRARKVAMIQETAPTVIMVDASVGDHQGYLAVGLAAAVFAIVVVAVVMVMLAAT